MRCLTCKWVFGRYHLQRERRTIPEKTPPIPEKNVPKLVEDSFSPVVLCLHENKDKFAWILWCVCQEKICFFVTTLSPQSYHIADIVPLLSDALKKVKVVIIKAKRFARSGKKRNFASVTVRNYRLPISRCFQTKSRRDAPWSVLRWQISA